MSFSTHRNHKRTTIQNRRSIYKQTQKKMKITLVKLPINKVKWRKERIDNGYYIFKEKKKNDVLWIDSMNIFSLVDKITF